jgi:hypothetical protein
MRIMLNVGCLDGQSLIDMNNLAVGYFPTETVEFGVYPAPVVTQAPQVAQQPQQEAPQPVVPAIQGQ